MDGPTTDKVAAPGDGRGARDLWEKHNPKILDLERILGNPLLKQISNFHSTILQMTKSKQDRGRVSGLSGIGVLALFHLTTPP
jgi:hypothetical protein